MIVVVAKIKAQSGKEDELAKIVRNVIPKVAEEEGTLVYRFHQSTGDKTEFMFYEQYTDGDALAHHGGTPYFKEMGAAMFPLLDGKPSIEMYEEIDQAKK